ncbi:MAG: hypothetical protein LWW77_06815 [Propionibacteriales bacterium]|nr:hypothetical protein [Propionibacteriales bacterium]
MKVRLAVASVIVLGLTACAAPAPAPSQPSAPLPVPSQTDANEPSNAPTSAGDPAANVKSYGTSSKECEAASGVLQSATEFGLKASLGTVTQADFEKAYTGANANALPVDALPTFADVKTASLKIVGLSAEETQTHVGEFSLALGNFVRVTEKICS